MTRRARAWRLSKPLMLAALLSAPFAGMTMQPFATGAEAQVWAPPPPKRVARPCSGPGHTCFLQRQREARERSQRVEENRRRHDKWFATKPPPPGQKRK